MGSLSCRYHCMYLLVFTLIVVVIRQTGRVRTSRALDSPIGSILFPGLGWVVACTIIRCVGDVIGTKRDMTKDCRLLTSSNAPSGRDVDADKSTGAERAERVLCHTNTRSESQRFMPYQTLGHVPQTQQHPDQTNPTQRQSPRQKQIARH